jgi:hypothetical protein
MGNQLHKDRIFKAAKEGFLEVNKPESKVTLENVSDGVATAIVKAFEEYEKDLLKRIIPR